jgi:hypothetical protein
VFSPDGKWLVSAATGNTAIQFWNVADGSEVRRLAEKDVGRSWYESSPLSFSPDGKLLAAAAQNAEIVLWELPARIELRRFSGHTKAVTSLAFSPDGKTLLSGSQDATLLLWDVGGAHNAVGRVERLDEKQLEKLWNNLASTDGDMARQAIAGLVAASSQTPTFLQARWKPYAPVDPGIFPQLITDLAHPDRIRRDKAAESLKSAGIKASPALYKVLQTKPELELRREIEAVLESIGEFPISPGQLRERRVIQVLERIGTPEAEQLLKTMAGAEPAGEFASDAKAALERLQKRRVAPQTKVSPEM